MLGVIVGVAAVVTMVAIATSARERIAAQIRSLGANVIAISPGSAMTSGARLGGGTAPHLSHDDALAIGAEVTGVVAVAPVLLSRAQFTFGSQNWARTVRGVTPGPSFHRKSASVRQRSAPSTRWPGLVADIGRLTARRRVDESEALFASPAWTAYEQELERSRRSPTGSAAHSRGDRARAKRADEYDWAGSSAVVAGPGHR